VKDTRILSNGEIGTQRQLLEHATNAELLGEDHAIVFLRLSADDDLALVGNQRAGQHMH
jgi:hypothetical protein